MMITTKQGSNVPLEVPAMTMVSIACTWHSVKSWLGQERKSQLMDDNPNVLDSKDLYNNYQPTIICQIYPHTFDS